MGSLQIDMLGTSFAIKASADDAYLKKLLNYYKEITEQIQRSDSLNSELQVAILAGIMICDELYKEESKTSQIEKLLSDKDSKLLDNFEYTKQVEKLTSDMIKKIDKVL